MTTLVETRQALELLSMGTAPERRKSKRLAGAPDYEDDDEFKFVRKSKKVKGDEADKTKKPTRSTRPVREATPDEDDFQPVSQTTRRKASAEPLSGQPQTKVPKKGHQRGAREASAELGTKATNGPSRNHAVKKSKAPTRAGASIFDSPDQGPARSAKIALPMSDTPIINRNKEMRKKGNGNRRSSLGSRGRRASSLIENGQSALPHREVKPENFYKHIAAEGLTEPRRMKQLLTWCGERALTEKPPHGSVNATVMSAMHGARAIQDQLLKEFGNRSDFSDWFSRDDSTNAPAILKPNPRNVELDEKVAQLEANIKRLQEEKKAWLDMRNPPPEQPPLFPSDEPETAQIELPDFNLLDEDDGKIRGYLADKNMAFATVRSRTEERLGKVRSTLEFEIDQLADNVHKLEQRVSVAGEEADKVLGLSARRLRRRDDREKRHAGTKDMPIMEVLRSLGSILPEGGG